MRSSPSIRFALAALFVSGFALLLGVSAVGLYVVLDRHHRREFDGRLLSTAFAANQMYELGREQFVNAHAATRRLIGELLFADETLVAFDTTGTLVAWSRRIPGAPILDDLTPFVADEPRSVSLRAGAYRVLHQPLGEGIDLYVGRDLTPLLEDLARLRLIFAVGLPMILVCGGILGVWGSGRALRPVVSIARAADRVGAEVAAGKDHFEPLPPRNAKDEVATLTTAFNRLIARLAAALQREREFSEQERTLLADTAHELRTPVAILQSSAEVALTSARSNDEYRTALESIAQESRALSALVNDLLLFSRRDSQGPLQIAQPMYLDDAVSSCLERIRTLPEAQGRHVRIGELEAAPVRADIALIERAVLALVHNALVHAPTSPVEVSTGIADRDGVRESWVRVRDWGPGIERDLHQTIFDRFTRLDTTKPGTGLGLSIVQLIVEASGGRIVLESAPGDGATFTLLFPTNRPTTPA